MFAKFNQESNKAKAIVLPFVGIKLTCNNTAAARPKMMIGYETYLQLYAMSSSKTVRGPPYHEIRNQVNLGGKRILSGLPDAQ